MVLHCCQFVHKKWGIRGLTIGQLTLIFIPLTDEHYKRTLNHEAIHRAQFKECGGLIPTYQIYRADRTRLMRDFSYDKRTAIRLTRFEQEAYNNAENLDYLKTRRRNEWLKYKTSTI